MKDIWMKQEMKMKEINEKTFRDRIPLCLTFLEKRL